MKKILLVLALISCTQKYNFKEKYKSPNEIIVDLKGLYSSIENEIKENGQNIDEADLYTLRSQLDLTSSLVLSFNKEITDARNELSSALGRRSLSFANDFDNHRDIKKIEDKYKSKIEEIEQTLNKVILNYEKELLSLKKLLTNLTEEQKVKVVDIEQRIQECKIIADKQIKEEEIELESFTKKNSSSFKAALGMRQSYKIDDQKKKTIEKIKSIKYVAFKRLRELKGEIVKRLEGK